METTTVNYKSYVIHTEENVEHGVFFRSPIQKVYFDAYGFDSYDEKNPQSAWTFLNRLKNPIRKVYERIIGNGNIVDNGKEWAEYGDFAGFRANKLCFPIYFKRTYRSLVASSQNPDDNIQEIRSRGYESEYETCAGACEVEKTVIRLKNGKKIKHTCKNSYHYTYRHIIEPMLDGKEG